MSDLMQRLRPKGARSILDDAAQEMDRLENQVLIIDAQINRLRTLLAKAEQDVAEFRKALESFKNDLR